MKIGITSKVAHEVPQPILTLGLAGERGMTIHGMTSSLICITIGGIPYIGASATTVYLAYKAELASHGISVGMDPGVALTILDQALNLQVTYGAVMLSALGKPPVSRKFLS